MIPSRGAIVLGLVALVAVPACGLRVAGRLETEHAGPDADEGGAVASPGLAGPATDGGARSDAATTPLSEDASVVGAANDAGNACVPAPRSCTTAHDCAAGRCCLSAGASGELIGSCHDECKGARVAACASSSDCDEGDCMPRTCACGEIVLACATISGACQ